MYDVPIGAICTNCKIRPASLVWAGDGGIIGVIHGAYTYWCERCSVIEQLDYARKAAARIPELEKKLAELAPIDEI